MTSKITRRLALGAGATTLAAGAMSTGAATTFNGSSAAISDRGWVSLTFKTTF